MAILAAVVASMVLGFIWYTPQVFGAMWMKELGKKMDDIKSPGPGYLVMVIASALTAYVMRHFAVYAGADTWVLGLQVGLWAWIGFVATVGLSRMMFAEESPRLFMINNGYTLVQFLIVGAIVAGM